MLQLLSGSPSDAPATAQTPRCTVMTDGPAQLYRFHAEGPAPSGRRLPVLLVPSLINRWYVLDLRPGASLVEALVARGLDVWCLDWGQPEAEDRHFTWDDVLARLARMVRKVRTETGVDRVALLGYCIGATLAGIHVALQHDVSAFINLAGPFDFSRIGKLGLMTDPRWFDGEAISAAGNMTAAQMQQGFQSLRPTAQISKWVNWLDKAHDPAARASFAALDGWASDNVAFPAAAYATWIGDFYQKNLLVQGQHYARGRRVDLGSIECPVLTIVTERDEICPPDAALALNERVASVDKQVLTVPGGHVGAVIGRHAKARLYPAIAEWLLAKG